MSQEIPTLAPGHYRLSRDVKNPRPDRREKYDWRKDGVLKAGVTFTVTQQQGQVPRMYATWGRWSLTQHITPSDALWAALVPALIPAPPSTSLDLYDAFERTGNPRNVSWDILVRLVEGGTVSVNQVEAALEAFNQEAEA